LLSLCNWNVSVSQSSENNVLHPFKIVLQKLFLSALFLHSKKPVIHISKQGQSLAQGEINLPKNCGKSPERKAQWCIKKHCKGQYLTAMPQYLGFANSY